MRAPRRRNTMSHLNFRRAFPNARDEDTINAQLRRPVVSLMQHFMLDPKSVEAPQEDRNQVLDRARDKCNDRCASICGDHQLVPGAGFCETVAPSIARLAARTRER
ncbi:hypothetical protein IVB44_06835 [Bradyrhizobium sp. 49]|uniref:hypothetical protein n=1 Tax=unclassified Bradyrhizobium TaxID=2631580 RepID=UPI001FFB43F4|nr:MULTISPECIES: hypothetical protein [unclassified Bradyrhizobium]MCK1266275.1 hypothetical protein [Bradyrhizobium sp. 84]MCK1370757.1 hypothetical protein [Bradyrhizobium sp. 49]